ncbi:MAG: VWA domain-containing protein [Candidatus Omnitrophota bacterium]
MLRDKRKIIFLSVSASLIFHAAFFTYSTMIEVPGVYGLLDSTRKFFNLKSVDQVMESPKPVREREMSYANAIKFERPAGADAAGAELRKGDEGIRKKEPLEVRDENFEPLRFAEQKMVTAADEKPSREVRRRRTRPELVGVKLDEDETAVDSMKSLDEAVVSAEFLERMPGFTPETIKGAGKPIEGRRGPGDLLREALSAITRKTGFTDMESYLMCEVTNYEDPGDNARYYRISIRAGNASSALETMPKEMVFLVDCSLSIQHDRLEEFKEGLAYCLRHLNAGDVFNVAAFKEKIIWFKRESVPPTEANIDDALSFVEYLSSGEGTDVYKALYECVKLPPYRKPSYVMLFSDGKPTHGLTNSRKIINEVSEFNKGSRPIFAFSGGVRVNRYFLDFISYRNRGWTEYAGRNYMIERALAGFYDKVKDPILLNLRYHVSGLDEKEMFPKHLPDFYRNAEFTLYGKYDDEDRFSLQFLGDTEDETNEYIIVGALSETPAGGREIARNWAFNKIYYLIGRLGEDDDNNVAIIKNINELCKKFDITTPYTEGINR